MFQLFTILQAACGNPQLRLGAFPWTFTIVSSKHILVASRIWHARTS